MATLREWAARLWGTIRRRRSDDDLAAELQARMDLAAEAARGLGLSSDNAVRAARTPSVMNRQAIVAGASRATDRPSRWARGPVTFVTAVALIMISTMAIGSRLWSPAGATLQAAVRFEARLAEDRPGAGLREVQLGGSHAPVYLHQEVIVSNEDVAQSRVVASDDPAHFNIALQFTTAGAAKMRQATADHVGRPIAILIDGEVVMAPRLTSPISESALVTGDFTKAEADRIANGIGVR